MRLSWSLLLLSGCWPFLPGSFDDYVDGDSDSTEDVDTGEGTDADTEADTEPDTEADTEPDTEADTEPDTDPDTDPPDIITNVTIPQLRRGEFPEGTLVRVSGVRVTSPQTDNGFWIQSGSNGLNAGIYVYNGTTSVASVGVGDRVAVIGEYIEFVSGSGSLAEIFVTDPNAVQVTGSNAPELVSDVPHSTLATPSSAQGFESNLVSIGPSEVTIAPDNFGQFFVEPIDGGPQVRVDDLFYDDSPEVGDRYESMTGILNFSFGFFRLEPRFESDLVPLMDAGGCASAGLCVDQLLPGDIVVTEVGFNPSNTIGLDETNEYVEIYNQSGLTVNLDGLEIHDTANYAIVSSDVVIPNNGYAVFGRTNASTWGWSAFGLNRDGTYGGEIAFSNSSGENITLYGPSPFLPIAESQFYPGGQVGRAWSLDPRAFSNPQQANAWCYATTFVGTQDRATPGLPNDTCGNFFP